jgi:hypothetical protein
MEIEITVTYALSKTVEVPAELAPDKDWNYPNREAFDEWVCQQANGLRNEEPVDEDAWVSTEAYETEHWNEVYSAS